MTTVKSPSGMYYNGRTRKPDEKFEMNKDEATILAVAGVVVIVDETVPAASHHVAHALRPAHGVTKTDPEPEPDPDPEPDAESEPDEAAPEPEPVEAAPEPSPVRTSVPVAHSRFKR